MKSMVKQEKFLSNIIDNLKTPTIAQIKALELFLSTSSNKINSEERDLIELTLNSCNNMQKMIDDFSFIAKINKEKIKLDYSHFDLAKLTQNVINEMNILLKYSNLKIQIASDNPTEIYADISKIKRAIENVLSYAINFAFKNSKIDIIINSNKTGVKFEVIFKGFCEDNKEILQIFKPNQEYLYKYIELYITKEIIKSHFGKIIFKNQEDDITVIGFYLP